MADQEGNDVQAIRQAKVLQVSSPTSLHQGVMHQLTSYS